MFVDCGGFGLRFEQRFKVCDINLKVMDVSCEVKTRINTRRDNVFNCGVNDSASNIGL